MAGYGVPYVLELIYSEHTVPHVLSGKAFARAIWTHLITAVALLALLIGNVHNIDFNVNVDDECFATKFHEALKRRKCQN